MFCFKKHSKTLCLFYKYNSFNVNTNILYDEKLDYYEILEIKDSASSKEIKMAYYKLAKLHHPDVKGDEIRFKNINLAYEVLKNEYDKRAYDHIRKEFLNNRTRKYDLGKKSSNKSENIHKNNKYYKRKSTKENEDTSNYERKYYEEMYRQYREDTYKRTQRNRYNKKENDKENDNDYDFEKEYEEILKEHYETFKKMYKGTQAKESQFNKFKINYKISYYDPVYPKFIPKLTNRHHLENRKRQFAKEKEDKFKLPNELIKDKDFLDTFSKESDSDCYDKRITLRKMLSVYSKKKVLIFVLLLSINIIIILKRY